jgi:hypothetical protein
MIVRHLVNHQYRMGKCIINKSGISKHSLSLSLSLPFNSYKLINKFVNGMILSINHHGGTCDHAAELACLILLSLLSIYSPYTFLISENLFSLFYQIYENQFYFVCNIASYYELGFSIRLWVKKT